MWGKYFKCGISIKKKIIHKVTTYLLFAREKQRQVGAWKFWDLSVFFNQIAGKGWLWSTSWEHQEPRELNGLFLGLEMLWLGNKSLYIFLFFLKKKKKLLISTYIAIGCWITLEIS